MGVCASENTDKPKRPKTHANTGPAYKPINSDKKINKEENSNISKTTSTTKKDDFILPATLCKHDDVNKYYRISSELLGEGASGKVCEAEGIDGKKYAIKKVNKSKIKSRKDILKEAEFNMKIKHEHIIKCIEIYEDAYDISFVLELAEGGDLFDLIVNSPKQKLPDYITIILFEQIMETVDYLHNDLGIVHRDLKPENLMVEINKDNLPEIKLIDFGLSDYKPIKGKPETYLKDFVGTPCYAAPELINKFPYDEKVDIWSLGVLMYNMATGYEPFGSKFTSQLHEQIILKKINFEKIEDLKLRELCKKFLDRNEERRIDAKTALEEIRKIRKEFEELFTQFEKEESVAVQNKREANEIENNVLFQYEKNREDYLYYKVFMAGIGSGGTTTFGLC